MYTHMAMLQSLQKTELWNDLVAAMKPWHGRNLHLIEMCIPPGSRLSVLCVADGAKAVSGSFHRWLCGASVDPDPDFTCIHSNSKDL